MSREDKRYGERRLTARKIVRELAKQDMAPAIADMPVAWAETERMWERRRWERIARGDRTAMLEWLQDGAPSPSPEIQAEMTEWLSAKRPRGNQRGSKRSDPAVDRALHDVQRIREIAGKGCTIPEAVRIVHRMAASKVGVTEQQIWDRYSRARRKPRAPAPK